MYAIQREYGYIATIAQISVAKIKIISIDANKLFLSPNCKGVKARLKTILSKNGNATIKAISFFQVIKKTFPNEIAIRIYRKVQTGPKRKAGGAQNGFINCEYQLYVSIQNIAFNC